MWPYWEVTKLISKFISVFKQTQVFTLITLSVGGLKINFICIKMLDNKTADSQMEMPSICVKKGTSHSLCC